MKILESILLTTITISIYSCAKHPEIYTRELEQKTYNGEPEQKTARTLIIDGEEIKDVTHGEFISWKCRDYPYGGKTLVEVGRVLVPDDYIHSDDYKEMDDATKEQLGRLMPCRKYVIELTGQSTSSRRPAESA